MPPTTLNRTATKDRLRLITTIIPTTTMMTHPTMTTTTRNQMPMKEPIIMVTTPTRITTTMVTTDPVYDNSYNDGYDDYSDNGYGDNGYDDYSYNGYDDNNDSDNYDYDNGGYSNDSNGFYSRWSFAVFDSASSEGVHSGHFHISTVLGILPPPPKMSCYNLTRLRLHLGKWHQPRATGVHLKPIFLRGSRHQPRAPNQSMEFQLAEYLDSSRNDSALVCDVMVLVCFEKFVLKIHHLVCLKIHLTSP